MPKRDITLKLPGFTIKKVSGYNPIILELSDRRKAVCIHCESKNLRKKDTFERRIQHESIGLYKVFLKFKSHKFLCRNCHRYFNQQFPGILKYQRATERLKNQIFHHHTEGMSQKSLSRDFKLGKSTIETWYPRIYQRINRQYLNRPAPIVLGIDEHFFTQKRRICTTSCDLKRNMCDP